MRLKRVEVALNECKPYFSSHRFENAPVRTLLAQALLILICAELERVIREQIRARCADIKDPELVSFLESCTDRVTRSLTISELAGLLNRFDAEFGKDFRSRLRRDRKTPNLYATLVDTRHRVAHGEEHTATLADVAEYYRHALIVLGHFRGTLFREPFHGTRTEKAAR